MKIKFKLHVLRFLELGGENSKVKKKFNIDKDQLYRIKQWKKRHAREQKFNPNAYYVRVRKTKYPEVEQHIIN